MQTENRFFDDIARMAGGALNALTGLKTEVEGMVRQQLEHFLATMNLVTREEFEAVQAMAQKAREEQEDLSARLAALEARLAETESAEGAKGRKAKASQAGETA